MFNNFNSTLCWGKFWVCITEIIVSVDFRKAKLAKTGRVLTNEKPETSFREMSVYPTEEDLEEDVELRKNKIDERKSSNI